LGWRRYAYGLYCLALDGVGLIPAHRLRRACYRHLFGMVLDPGSVIYRGLRVRSPRGIRIGVGSSIGHRCELDGRGGLRIGRNVNLSSEAMLWTAQHDFRAPGFPTVLAPVEIGDFAWIGPRCIVLPGVSVAAGCVIAAGAVVTRSTEPFGVYAGVPARRIGERPCEAASGYTPGADHIPFI
jgi:acetyltransferase-like isoleucine patch superfamily enzyme